MYIMNVPFPTLQLTLSITYFQVPLIRQTTPAIEFVETPHVTKEAQFECISNTTAPLEKYQWYFRNRLISSNRNLRLNLTRTDFNESVKCVIQKLINATHPIGQRCANIFRKLN